MGQRLESGGFVAPARSGPSIARARRRVSAAFWRHSWLRGVALLVPPLAWFLLLYIAALAALFVSAFWSVDVFTTKVVHVWNVDNFKQIVDSAAWRRVVVRTVVIAPGMHVEHRTASPISSVGATT